MPYPSRGAIERVVAARQRLDATAADLDRRQGYAPNLHEQRDMAATAARHSQLFADLELPPPAPRPGESPRAHRVRIIRELIGRAPTQWRDANLDYAARVGQLAPIEGQVVDAAQRVAADRTRGSFRRPGALREIRRADQSGCESVEYMGDPRAWMNAFMCPVQTTVVAFTTGPGGRKLL